MSQKLKFLILGFLLNSCTDGLGFHVGLLCQKFFFDLCSSEIISLVCALEYITQFSNFELSDLEWQWKGSIL